MILVDTSIWIHEFSRRRKEPVDPDIFVNIATCAPIIQEILQGIRLEAAFQELKDRICALPCLDNPLSLDLFLEGADLYRSGRKRGITIRSSTDCLIAAIAIKNKIPVSHLDRDFDQIAKYSRLELAENPF